MGRLALIDIVRPYVMAGASLQAEFQHVLELLHVDEYDTAVDEDAIVFWGIARIDDSAGGGIARIDDSAGGLPTFPSPSRNVTFEWHDLAVRFRLTAARLPAAAVVPAQLNDPDVRSVLEAMGSATAATRSDFPNTQFRLDLMFELVTATFPKLTGAKVSGAFLVPDTEHRTVKIQLPRVVMRLTQDSSPDTDVDLSLGTWGAETIDDADPAIGSLIRMTPTYALADSGKFGFGFEKAVVDFSEERTPPDILERFGLGDDWQGIHLPELRLFFADDKASGTAGNVGARDLLIGFEPEVALWGDVSFDADFRGDALAVGLRLYSVDGTRIDPTPVNPNKAEQAEQAPQARYQVTVPSSAGPETENSLLFVDVKRGAAPFTITAVTGEDHPANLDEFPDDAFFDDPSNSPEDLSIVQRVRLFSHDQRVALRIKSRNAAQRRVIVLDVYPDRQAASLHPAPKPPNDARPINVEAGSFGSIAIRSPQASTSVVIAFTPPNVSAFSADGAAIPVTGGQATVPIAAGETVRLAATWQRPGGGELGRISAYFERGYPTLKEIRKVSGSPIEQSKAPVVALDVKAFREAWVSRDPSQPKPRVRIDGYASREAELDTKYNRDLATRRGNELSRRILDERIPGLTAADIHPPQAWGEDKHPSQLGVPAPTDPRLIDGHTPGNQSADAAHKGGNYRPEQFRTAVASIIAPTIGTSTLTADLVRDEERPPDRAPDPAPPASQQPDWLRTIGGTLRWEREPYPIAGELRMTVDFQTAHEEGLEHFRNDIETIRPGLEAAEEARLPDAGSAPNPEDGVVEFRLAITYDPGTGTFTETLVARAAEADRDGLWSWGTIPAADSSAEPSTDPWRDLLGLYFTLAPLAASTVPETANDGEIVPLVVALATPVVVTTLGVAHVLRITHYGVELGVRHDADEFHAAVVFDVESAIWLDLRLGTGPDAFEVVTTRPDKPVKIRYKAVGFGLDIQPDRPTRFLPVFDSARGYTIDLADSGSLRVLPSLGGEDLIQVLGARIARTNPLNIEVELGLGVDLGVIKVDTFGFRLPIDPLDTPSITAIGISVDIPNAINGRGYLEILATGFAGQLDLSLPTVGMRIAGGLRVQTVTEGDRTATGVLVTVAAELPTGIPLGGTGLAMFGLLGLFGMHHRRLEDPTARDPALSWLVDTVAGDPTRVEGWGPALDSWSVGLGIVAGTIEGGTIVNIKGLLGIELPGPRVVLFVKANLVKPRRPTREPSTGALFAVVDISPQRVLIGIQAEYEIEGILELHIPAEAGFFYDPPAFPPEHFYLDVGTIERAGDRTGTSTSSTPRPT